MDEGDPSPILKKLNKELKVFFKKHSFYLGIILTIAFSGWLVTVSGKKIIASSSRNFYFSSISGEKKDFNSKTFIGPVRNFIGDYPEMVFLRKDTLVGVSSPAIIAPAVLASVIDIDKKITREDIIEYKIKPGDNLSSIAKKFDLSLQTILWANDLKSNSAIKPGQEITILPVDGLVHIVGKGETIGSISKKYKADSEKIIDFNKLSSSNKIFEHQLLVIPGGKMPSVRHYSRYAKRYPAAPSTHDFYGISHHYPWGQCTYWAAQKRALPKYSWGNARDWLNSAIVSGFPVCRGSNCKPEAGAIVSLKGSSLGHVAYVERVEGSKIIFSEMNYYGLGKVDYRSMIIGDPRIFGYIYRP